MDTAARAQPERHTAESTQLCPRRKKVLVHVHGVRVTNMKPAESDLTVPFFLPESGFKSAGAL